MIHARFIRSWSRIFHQILIGQLEPIVGVRWPICSPAILGCWEIVFTIFADFIPGKLICAWTRMVFLYHAIGRFCMRIKIYWVSVRKWINEFWLTCDVGCFTLENPIFALGTDGFIMYSVWSRTRCGRHTTRNDIAIWLINLLVEISAYTERLALFSGTSRYVGVECTLKVVCARIWRN